MVMKKCHSMRQHCRLPGEGRGPVHRMFWIPVFAGKTAWVWWLIVLSLFNATQVWAAQVHTVLHLPATPEEIVIRSDQQDGFYVLWTSTDSGHYSLRLQEVNFRGRRRWDEPGRLVAVSTAGIEALQLAATTDGVSMIWRENREPDPVLMWDHLDNHGHQANQQIRSSALQGRMALVSEKKFDRLIWQERNGAHCDLDYVKWNSASVATEKNQARVLT